MKLGSIRILTFLIAPVFSNGLSAQISELSLETALSSSVDTPSRLAGEVAAIRLAIANSNTLPSIYQTSPELRLTQVDRWNGVNEQEYAVRLRTTNPWILGSQKRAQEHRVEMAESQLALKKWQIQYHAKILYFEALNDQKRFQLAKDWQVAMQENLKWHEDLLESGQQTLPEVLEIRLDTNDAIDDARAAKLKYKRSLNLLLSWIGKTLKNQPHASPHLSTNIDRSQDAVNLDPEKILEDYQSQHPLPQTFMAQENISKEEVRGVDAGHKPWISFLQAGVSQNSNSWEGEDWSLRVGIEVPIFDQRNKLTDAAQAQHELARAQLEAHLFETKLQIQEKVANLEVAWKHLELTGQLTENILKQVTSTLEEDQQTPTLSPDTRSRLLKGLHRIKQSNLEAEYAYQQARLELDYFLPSLTK